MSNFMLLVWFVSLIAMIIYIVKWIKNRRGNNNYRKKFLISLAVMVVSFILVGATGGNDATRNASNSSDTTKVARKSKTPKVVKKIKYVGKDKYDIAKKENLALIAKKKKLSKQEDKLQDQRDKIEEQVAQEKQQAQEQQAEKKQQQVAKAAQKQQEQQEQQASQQTEQSSQAQSSQGQSQGDMNTDDAGTIVGNSRSHIYHVPGQRGYNMNSANAVYFKSEQDAINAGYRRSKV